MACTKWLTWIQSRKPGCATQWFVYWGALIFFSRILRYFEIEFIAHIHYCTILRLSVLTFRSSLSQSKLCTFATDDSDTYLRRRRKHELHCFLLKTNVGRAERNWSSPTEHTIGWQCPNRSNTATTFRTRAKFPWSRPPGNNTGKADHDWEWSRKH